jgi:hypothetical protein
MTDLQNNWHNHGDSGSKPADGKDYSGGDNVYAKTLDFLFNQQRLDKDEINDAILRRIRHLHGDVALNGLVVSQGANALEVDVSSGDGYVDGQYTEDVAAATVTLSSNGGDSTRTDSIWVNSSGQVGKSEGATSVSETRMKLAEADVETDDTISAIRNYARDAVRVFASENAPPYANNGDRWYDHSNERVKTYINGSWTAMFPADGSVPLDGTLHLHGDVKDGAGNTVYSQSNNYVPDGRLQYDYLRTDGDQMWGNLDLNSYGLRRVAEIQFKDGGGDGKNWGIREELSSSLTFEYFSDDMMIITDTGDLRVRGELTENASL